MEKAYRPCCQALSKIGFEPVNPYRSTIAMVVLLSDFYARFTFELVDILYVSIWLGRIYNDQYISGILPLELKSQLSINVQFP